MQNEISININGEQVKFIISRVCSKSITLIEIESCLEFHITSSLMNKVLAGTAPALDIQPISRPGTDGDTWLWIGYNKFTIR